jgi:hypothetical protein
MPESNGPCYSDSLRAQVEQVGDLHSKIVQVFGQDAMPSPINEHHVYSLGILPIELFASSLRPLEWAPLAHTPRMKLSLLLSSWDWNPLHEQANTLEISPHMFLSFVRLIVKVKLI